MGRHDSEGAPRLPASPPAGRSPEFSVAVDDDGPVWTFSQTAVNRARRCPERARAYWNGEYVDPPGVEAIVGTAVHAAMDAYFTGASIEQAMADALAAEWHDGIDPEHIWGVPERAAEAAVGAWERLRRYIGPIHPIASELELQGALKGGRHRKRTRGKVDVIHWMRGGTLEVVDLKVSKGRSYSSINELQKYAVQPTIYLNNASQEFEVPINKTQFTYLVVNPITKVIDTKTVTRTGPDVKRLAVECDGYIDAWQSRLPSWPLRVDGWWCSAKWCNNWSNCQGGVK